MKFNYKIDWGGLPPLCPSEGVLDAGEGITLALRELLKGVEPLHVDLGWPANPRLVEVACFGNLEFQIRLEVFT